MSDDSNIPLAEIALRHGVSLKQQLLSIQETAVPQEKCLSFIRRLECFIPRPHNPRSLTRHPINAFVEKRYVAVSYTWSPARHETSSSHGSYSIQPHDGTLPPEPSPVRDSIFRRAFAYAAHRGTPFIWIDRHSIQQHDPDLQRQAVQGMDLVYALSRHPVALLGRPITTEGELHLLWQLVTSQLAEDDATAGARLMVPLEEALAALELLDSVTADLWWTRAWTFQEAYRAGDRMALLMTHPPGLEEQKMGMAPVFDVLPGEIILRYTAFATASTRLCLALRPLLANIARQNSTGPSKEDIMSSEAATSALSTAERILVTAARYTLLLPPTAPMSPAIITHIQHRALLNPSDRLAIVANCCWYPLRLDTASLQVREGSLAVAMLGLCLLNGEILHNGAQTKATDENHGTQEKNHDDSQNAQEPASLTVASYLRTRLFSNLRAPRQDHRLTFNKSCRLPSVLLTEEGILSQGSLWRLGPVLTLPPHDPSPYPNASSPGSPPLSPNDQSRLKGLASHLQEEHPSLAQKLTSFLERDPAPTPSWSDTLLRAMAASVTTALSDGAPLQLAAPLTNTERCLAIFAPAEVLPEGTVVFTASRPRRQGTSDVDRHVSLVVDCETTGGGMPRLFTRQWVLGMCFPDESEPDTDIVFPWPPELESFAR
ncbi:hypothetical protein ACHAQH_003079 [Verticillium albo-atrum]